MEGASAGQEQQRGIVSITKESPSVRYHTVFNFKQDLFFCFAWINIDCIHNISCKQCSGQLCQFNAICWIPDFIRYHIYRLFHTDIFHPGWHGSWTWFHLHSTRHDQQRRCSCRQFNFTAQITYLSDWPFRIWIVCPMDISKYSISFVPELFDSALRTCPLTLRD